MSGLWAKPAVWYDKHLKANKDAEFAEGFGLSVEDYSKLKEKIKTVALKVKPRDFTYRGNKEDTKRHHVAAFCSEIPEFGNAPDQWKMQVIPRIIGAVHSNAKRKQPGTPSKIMQPKIATTPPAQPSPFRFDYLAQPSRQPSLFNLKHQAQSTLPFTASPFESGYQALHTPRAQASPLDVKHQAQHTPSQLQDLPRQTEPIDKSEITIEIRNAGGDVIGVFAASYILLEGRRASLAALRQELEAYEELGSADALKNSIYLDPWKYGHIPIRADSSLNMALDEMAKNGVQTAVLRTLQPPPQTTQAASTTNMQPPSQAGQTVPQANPARNRERETTPDNESTNPSKRVKSGTTWYAGSDMLLPSVNDNVTAITETTNRQAVGTVLLGSHSSGDLESNSLAIPGEPHGESGNAFRDHPGDDSMDVDATPAYDWYDAGPNEEQEDGNGDDAFEAKEDGNGDDGAFEAKEDSNGDNAFVAKEDGNGDDGAFEAEEDGNGDDGAFEAEEDGNGDDSAFDAEEDSLEDEGDGQEEVNLQKFYAQFNQVGLRNLDTELARMSEEYITLTHQYFPLVKLDTLTQSEPFTLPNWGLRKDFKLSPYQLFFMSWAFAQERSISRGGICADPPGSGKSVQIIGLDTMNYYHYQNVMEVEQDQSCGNLSRHLPLVQSLDARCPTAKLQPIACYCEMRNKDLYPDVPRRGISVIITPNPGLPSFRNDIKRMMKGAPIMSRTHPPRFAILAPGYENDNLCGALSPDEWGLMCKDADWSEEEQYERDNQTFMVGNTSRTSPWSPPMFSGARATDSNATENDAPPHAARFTLITTRACLKTRLIPMFICTRAARWTYRTTSKHYTHQKTRNLLQVGRLYWDEVHQELSGTVIVNFIHGIVEEYRRSQGVNPAVWGASGTPDNGNPIQPLRFILAGLWSAEWATKNSLKGGPLEVLLELNKEDVKKKAKAFDKLCERAKTNPEKAMQDDKYDELVAFFRKVILAFQIRRAESIVWYDGKPLIPKVSALELQMLQAKPGIAEASIIHRLEALVSSENRRKYDELLFRWEEEGSDPRYKPAKPSLSASESYVTARTAATIAQVVQYWERISSSTNKGTRRCAGSDDVVSQWIKESLGASFTKILDDNFAENAKFRLTCTICDQARRSMRMDGSPCKIIIATRIPLVLACWRNRLSKKYGSNSVICYMVGMNNAERAAALENFESDNNAWILLCTFACASLGLNVQRANYAIMVEPSHKYTEIKQFFARIDRRGQTEPKCYGYVLVNQSSSIENRMVKSTEFTKTLQKTIYSVAESSRTAAGWQADVLAIDD
jgi:hypothetical protein